MSEGLTSAQNAFSTRRPPINGPSKLTGIDFRARRGISAQRWAFPGTDLQLRAGGTPVLAEWHTVATSTGAGGTVQLSVTSPVHARYLLIWFTKAAADASGTYQVSVYRIGVQGRP
jgi:hypothetical protein